MAAKLASLWRNRISGIIGRGGGAESVSDGVDEANKAKWHGRLKGVAK